MLRPLSPLLGLLLLAGCAAGSSQTAASSHTASTASRPAGADSLADVGLRHGPDDFFLPADLRVTGTIDQPNVVAIFLPPDQGARVSGWLAQRLGPGWQVTADRNQSVLWHSAPGRSQPWQGSFTCSEQTCALTLRQQ